MCNLNGIGRYRHASVIRTTALNMASQTRVAAVTGANKGIGLAIGE